MKKSASAVEFELLIARLCRFAEAQSSPDCTTADTAANDSRAQDIASSGTDSAPTGGLHRGDEAAEFFRDSAAVSSEPEAIEYYEACPAAIGGRGD